MTSQLNRSNIVGRGVEPCQDFKLLIRKAIKWRTHDWGRFGLVGTDGEPCTGPRNQASDLGSQGTTWFAQRLAVLQDCCPNTLAQKPAQRRIDSRYGLRVECPAPILKILKDFGSAFLSYERCFTSIRGL